MKSRCVLQFFYFLSAIILSKAQDMVGPDLYCFTSIRGNVQTRISFLHEDTVGVRSFYLTIWSQDMRLVTCTVNLNPQITERYHSLCKTSNTRGQEVSYGFNISSILLALQKADCAHLEASSASQLTIRTRTDETERKARRKRAWIFPGTLWCGGGSMAHGYEELGMFEGTDRCCREHDHCLQIIPAFTVNYGVFNRNLFTVSHCECDQRFRQCLLDVNDSISNMVGYSFFNILRIPCFELKQQRRCTEMYWWGIQHIKVGLSDYSTLRRRDSPQLSSNSDLQSSSTAPSPLTQMPEHQPHQTTAAVTKTNKSHKDVIKKNGCCGHRKRVRGDAFQSGYSQLLCESFKHLDYCKFKIPPLKKKYGLQNMESKTAYHCDCTSRCLQSGCSREMRVLQVHFAS
uniref:phospholipase A2 n=1 Tax=Neolamprologus brichardi TaxID=32507 RepID=A0A3Q4N0U6_NEOBR